MSSFSIKVRHKQSGEIHTIWCLDDYFGKHKYGYLPNIEAGGEYTEKQFYELYEIEESNDK